MRLIQIFCIKAQLQHASAATSKEHDIQQDDAKLPTLIVVCFEAELEVSVSRSMYQWECEQLCYVLAMTWASITKNLLASNVYVFLS